MTDPNPQASHSSNTQSEPEGAARPLTPAAQRALAEAAERRARLDANAHAQPVELGGRAGPDPARYGDWEQAGIISDF